MILKNKLRTAAAAALIAAFPASALAQIAAGAGVTDPQGGEVGTVTAVQGDNVVLRTDRHSVALPSASFTAHNGGYLFAMTRDELNAAVDQQRAAAEQAVAEGALIRDTAGQPVGTIVDLDAGFATVDLGGDARVRLPRSALAPTPQGPVIGVTAAELRAQVAANAPSD
jgi:preprotein translocase subunit YajC